MLRTNAGLTQEELGNLLGVQKAAIQKYESGNINFKVNTIIKLSKIFGVTVGYILGTEAFDEKYNAKLLKHEVYMIEGVHRRFGKLGIELYQNIKKLNKYGLIRLATYAEDISNNPKYTKCTKCTK
jgi:transcriptional regulator with XRE-family HTH domain